MCVNPGLASSTKSCVAELQYFKSEIRSYLLNMDTLEGCPIDKCLLWCTEPCWLGIFPCLGLTTYPGHTTPLNPEVILVSMKNIQ